MRRKWNEKEWVYFDYLFRIFLSSRGWVEKVVVTTKTKSEEELKKIQELYLECWQKKHFRRKPWGNQKGKWRLCQNSKCFNAFYFPSWEEKGEKFYCCIPCYAQCIKPLVWTDEKIAERLFQRISVGGKITPLSLQKEEAGIYSSLRRKRKRGEVRNIQDAIDKITLQNFSQWSDCQKICWFLDGAHYQNPLFFEQLNFLKENPVIIADIGKVLKERGVLGGSFFPRAKDIVKRFFKSENERKLKNRILEIWQENKMEDKGYNWF